MTWLFAIGGLLLGSGLTGMWLTRRRGRAPAGHDLRCSFCGQSQREVAKLIAGPDVTICDRCVALCAEIIAADVAKGTADPSDPWTPPS